jgi:hypothetical protein
MRWRKPIGAVKRSCAAGIAAAAAHVWQFMRALRAVAEIIHDIDLKHDKFGRDTDPSGLQIHVGTARVFPGRN